MRLFCPWDFPGKNTGVGCHFLLQEIFLSQGLNPGLLHYRQMLLLSEPPGKSIQNQACTHNVLSRTKLKRATIWVVFQSSLKVQLVECHISFIQHVSLLKVILPDGSLHCLLTPFIHLLSPQQDSLNIYSYNAMLFTGSFSKGNEKNLNKISMLKGISG